MASQILSGSVTPTGNFTLYTNNTGQNVRLIIHFLWVAGASIATYSTRRVNITGGSHGTVQFPVSNVFWRNPTAVQRIDLRIGKDVAFGNAALTTTATPDNPTDNANGGVKVTLLLNGVITEAEGVIVFPTEIVMRPNQQMVFEASSPTSQQLIAFNITVMPEGG